MLFICTVLVAMRLRINRKVLVLFLAVFIISLYGLFLFHSKATSQREEAQKILVLTKKIDSVSIDLIFIV